MNRPVDSSYLVNLFRFEYLKKNLENPLSSDAFSKFADGEKDDRANNKEVVEATQHLLDTVMNSYPLSFHSYIELFYIFRLFLIYLYIDGFRSYLKWQRKWTSSKVLHSGELFSIWKVFPYQYQYQS